MPAAIHSIGPSRRAKNKRAPARRAFRPRTTAQSPAKSAALTAHPHPQHPQHLWIAQLDQLQRGFQLNQIELATQLLHCALRSLILWKKGRAPNPALLIRLHELTRLHHALAQLMPPDEIGPWMKRTNDYLDPLTPLEALQRGQIDRLWHIIHNTGSGMPT